MAVFNVENHFTHSSKCSSSKMFLSISILVIICTFTNLANANGESGSGQEATFKHSQIQNELTSNEKSEPRPKTVQDMIMRFQRSQTRNTEQKTCVIEVQEVRRIQGRCIRLMGGQSACQSSEYLDPINEGCQ